jgi:hypothetical protein
MRNEKEINTDIMKNEENGNYQNINQKTQQSYVFLQALLSTTSPTVLRHAKEWIYKKSSPSNPGTGPATSGLSSPPATGTLVSSTPSNTLSNSNKSSSNSRQNKQSCDTVKNDKRNVSMNSHSSKPNPTPTPAAPSDKHAHALVFKIEEFELKLLSVIQELDKFPKTLDNFRNELNGEEPPTLYPPYLSHIINLITTKGRNIVKSCKKENNIEKISDLKRKNKNKNSRNEDTIDDGEKLFYTHMNLFVYYK